MLGTVLLRPQAFADPPAEDEPTVDALFRAVSLVARDLAGPGTIFAAITDEVSAALDRLQQQVEPRLQAASASMQALFQPLVDAVSGVAGGATSGDPAALAASGAGVVRLVAGMLRALSPDRVATTLGRCVDVLEHDLGLDQASVSAAFAGSFDRIVTAIEGTGGDGVVLASALRELRGAGASAPTLPPIGKDTLVPPLAQAIQRSGIPAVAAKVADQLEAAANALAPLAALQTLSASATASTPAPHGAPVPHTAAAAHGTGPKDPPAGGAGGGSPDDPTVTPGPTPGTGNRTAWYATWYTGQRQTTSVDPAGHPLLAEVKFGSTLTPTAMEAVAFHSRWIADLLEAVLHASSIERGDIWANFVNVLWRSGDAALVGFGDVDVPAWGRWLVGAPLTVLGSFEGTRFDDAFGLTLMLADWGEAVFYARLVWLAREALLSLLTLINGNTERIEGFAYLIGELFTIMFPGLLALASPGTYGAPQTTTVGGVSTQLGDWWVIWFSLLGTLITVATTYLAGLFLTRAIAGDWPKRDAVLRLPLRERMLYPIGVSGGFSSFLSGLEAIGTGAASVFLPIAALVSHLLDFCTYYFLFNEGKTDDGHLGGEFPPGTPIKAAGYPSDFASSPYKLPWNKDASFQCAQGNHGAWSHTPFSFQMQLYAFDFTLDQGDEVLAMRAGVVWDFTEGNPTGGSNQNDLFILHDGPVAGVDFDQNGAAVQTIAHYIHEVQGSVTTAFGSTPVKEKENGITAIAVTGAGPATIRFTVANSAPAQPFTVGQAIVVSGSNVAAFNASWNVTNVGGAAGAWFFEATSAAAVAAPTAPFGRVGGIGTRVRQGQLVMLADKAGRAAYNHVHVHVRPMKADFSGPDGLTIPFVFSDEDLAGDHGVPKSLNYYVSSNLKN